MPLGGAIRSRHAGRLLALALIIGLLAVAETWRSYREATDDAERHAAGYARLLAEQTERTIQAVDFTLMGMRDALLMAPTLPPNDPSYRAQMTRRLQRLPYVRNLFVMGPHGFITHDTNYPQTVPGSRADRLYFQVHRDSPDAGLYIGRPLRSRSAGVWFISLSRRITNPDGSFGGIVVAAVEPRYFKRFYKDLSFGNGSIFALLHENGTLLARVPLYKATIGTSYADGSVLALAKARGNGVAWIKSRIDGRRRVIGYRRLAGEPLVVVAGWSHRAVYNAWEEHTVFVGIASMLVWALAAALTVLRLKYRHREQEEEAHLAQVRRLEMMGRIAGAIAHDLGNTIKIARTTFALLKPVLAARQDAMVLVEEADRSLKSAFEIIDRLLAFARRHELSPKLTDLAELISGLTPMLRQATGPRIRLDLEVAGPLIVSIDPIHLESALLNLVLNSKDAMPDGGRIVIALREAKAPQRPGRVQDRAPASSSWAEIVVRDNGTGMSRQVVERAFEPFFTTRGSGSGLGLSQVVGFVKQSAGEVRIESREDRGTAVRLLFPTVSASDEPGSGPSSTGPGA